MSDKNYENDKLRLSQKIAIMNRIFEEIDSKSHYFYGLAGTNIELYPDVDLLPEEIHREYEESVDKHIEDLERIVLKINELPFEGM